MSWLFEWNWLGHVWAWLIGGGLFMAAMAFVIEIAATIRTGRGQQGTTMIAGIMTTITASNTLLFGLVSIFVWDFKTALWLVGGTLAALVAMPMIAFPLLKLFRR